MVSMAQTVEIPAQTALLRDFVNTLDVETGEEALTSPGAVARWLGEHRLIDPPVQATETDHDRALRLREALRAALIANHGGGSETDGPRGGTRLLDAECAAYPVWVSLNTGAPVLEPLSGGCSAGLARLVAAIVASSADGTWARLKVCPEDTCQWAFVDTSKNRSRTWCAMRVCGNRSKTRSYRARRRSTTATDETMAEAR